MMKLTKEEQKIYETCLAQCAQCLLHGECELQEKLKERKQDEKETEK